MIDLDIKVPTRLVRGRRRGTETGEASPVHDHATVDR